MSDPWTVDHNPAYPDMVHISAQGIKSAMISCFQPGSYLAHIVITVRTPAGDVHQLSVKPGPGGLLKVQERLIDAQPAQSPREVPAHAG